MIGDIVAVNNTPLQIAALGTVKAGFIDAKGEMFYHYYDNVEPIPLTAEILLKNGYKHYAENMYEYYELAEDYYSIEAKEVNDGLWRIKVEHEEIFNDTEICSVSYIHQLQQFFRLCGIEKEIEL